MSNGLNKKFGDNPLRFIGEYTVDNKNWLSDLKRIALIAEVNKNKCGWFDFEEKTKKTKLVVFKIAPQRAVLFGEASLPAYWCPYVTGTKSIGYVDFKKTDPDRKFVFTAGMNGCRLVVTNYSKDYWRVYHHQHPDGDGGESKEVWGLIRKEDRELVSSFGWDKYGADVAYDNPNVPVKAGQLLNSPLAFNFLYYSDRLGGWCYVSRPLAFDMNGVVSKIGQCKTIPITQRDSKDPVRTRSAK